MFRIAIPLLFASLLAGCNTTLHVQKPDAATGMYATATTILGMAIGE